mmetsp:Transcript_26194/g.42572  ORF Transcript_26194/g.42572 Transcript_26194/m.42572 type:complete len:83 (+) Transcript_26194:162-410(+)
MRQAHPCEHNIISKHSTFQQKIISPKNDVENAGVDATVEEVDPSLGNARKLVSLTICTISFGCTSYVLDSNRSLFYNRSFEG